MSARALTLACALFLLAPLGLLKADDAAETRAKKLAAATAKAASQQQYLLQHKYKEGEVLRWKVVHLASTETKIQGNTQNSQSRSASVKRWVVTKVEPNGNIHLTHSVETVDMWHKVSDRPEVRYNSATMDTPPAGYEQVASTVGVPLSTYIISPSGEVVERESKHKQMKFGVGDAALPLPKGAVKIGAQWTAPQEVKVRSQDKRVHKVKCRQVYTLKDVTDGLAKIEVKTEILTPIDNAQLQSQLMQQMTHGVLYFHLGRGRLLTKQLEWDESVIGFSGADSMMQYLARFTEEILPDTGKVAGPAPPSDAEAAAEVADIIIKDRDGKPSLRR